MPSSSGSISYFFPIFPIFPVFTATPRSYNAKRRRASVTEQAPGLTRHDFEAKIVKRCWEDEEFRKEFTADPAGAFVTYLKVPLASLPSISVHQEDPGSWHIVLPASPANASRLSEEDLEKVAGGAIVVPDIVLASMAVSGALVSAGATVTAGVSLQKGW
jgi:hypothetical protein